MHICYNSRYMRITHSHLYNTDKYNVYFTVMHVRRRRRRGIAVCIRGNVGISLKFFKFLSANISPPFCERLKLIPQSAFVSTL